MNQTFGLANRVWRRPHWRCLQLVAVTSLLACSLPSYADNLADLHWYGLNDTVDRTKYAQYWQQYSIGAGYCDGNLDECITAAQGAYLVLTGTKVVLAADLFTRSNAAKLAGVIILGTRSDMPKRARPTSTRPKLLALMERDDPGDAVVRLRKLTSSLRNKGVDTTLLFAPPDTLAKPTSSPLVRDLIRTYLGATTVSNQSFATLLKAHFNWQNPRWNNDEYRSQFKFLTTIKANKRTHALFKFFFRREPHLLKQWEFARYTAFDLLAYRDAVAPNARYIKFANRRGQFFFMDTELYAEFEPFIITGVDDESNMYRFSWFYRTHKNYSWQAGQQNVSVRTLGPAIHFRKAPSDDLVVPLLLRSAIPLDGISFIEDDPLTEIATLPDELQNIITSKNNCIYCHAIGSIQPRAHHIDAMSLEPQGGFALPLNEYPDPVMHAFLFDQERVAAEIGMSPNYIDDTHVDAFWNWLSAQ